MNNKLIEAAKCCQSAQELIELAAKSGIELSAEKASEYFKALSEGSLKLAEDELDNVSGGGCSHKQTCPYCGTENITYVSQVAFSINYECNVCHRTFSVKTGPIII